MNVKELMTRPAKSCGPESSLEKVASIMKDYDCGIVPIIKEDRKLVGIITDRDICLAVVALHQKPRDIEERLVGIISMNDILLGLPRWKGEQSQALSSAKIIDAFQSICSHNHAIAAA